MVTASELQTLSISLIRLMCLVVLLLLLLLLLLLQAPNLKLILQKQDRQLL
jgi:hypothetical protein